MYSLVVSNLGILHLWLGNLTTGDRQIANQISLPNH